MDEFAEFQAYQKASAGTAIYPQAGQGHITGVSYAALGLASEAGEVAGRVKKIIRDKGGVMGDDDAQVIADEVGDCLWYVAALARELGIDMNVMASRNVAKLRSRQERGVLKGSGDKR